MKIKNLQINNYISFAVLMQSFLIILQHVLISVFYFDPEDTTVYRVLLTAIPLSCAILIVIYEKWRTFIIVYTITLVILIFNIIIFPQNEIFLWQNSLRFLLPVVIPTALCLTYVPSVDIVESILYKISWITAFLALVYAISYLLGIFLYRGYSMSFSYGLLLPMLSLFSKKNMYSIIASLFLFLMVVGIGSRGAAVCFVLYVLYDIFQVRRNFVVLLMTLLGVFFLTLSSLAEWFESLGIFSRTLYLFLNDVGHMSGRDILYDRMLGVFWNNPIMGIGLFGDRLHLGGAYVHNIILELYLNWGIFGATFILLYFLWKFIATYKNSDKNKKNILVKYSLACVAPLMFSGSYLVDYDLAIFIGVLFLISRENRNSRDSSQGHGV